jgi:hypothetical protein
VFKPFSRYVGDARTVDVGLVFVGWATIRAAVVTPGGQL